MIVEIIASQFKILEKPNINVLIDFIIKRFAQKGSELNPNL